MSAAASADLLRAVGRNVRALRAAQSLSRQALARRAGLSPRFLAGLENDGVNISLERLAALAAALQVPITGLLPTAPAATAARAGGSQPPRLVIALLGLRGAGKSTVGALLARRLRLPFHELDEWIEKKAGLGLAEIFAVHGEQYYRRLERAALSEFLKREQPAVLAVSGGLVTDPQSYELLRARCLTIWLQARPQNHWERVVRQGDRRPMAASPHARGELKALLAARQPLYEQAELKLDTSPLTAAQAVSALLRCLRRAGFLSQRPAA
jgi:XRE family aerobic/anaerobic benzoate catabolism transcriptional regulator